MFSLTLVAPLFFAYASALDLASSTGCCAFGGTGAGTTLGVSTITFPGHTQTTTQIPVAFATSGASDKPWAAVVFAPVTSPNDSLMGWFISQNATAQTLWVWANTTGTPTCSSDSVLLPQYYVPGFSQCTGAAPGALWQQFSGSYSLGKAPVEQWTSRNGDSSAAFFTQGCLPVYFSAGNSPFLGRGPFQSPFKVAALGHHLGLPQTTAECSTHSPNCAPFLRFFFFTYLK